MAVKELKEFIFENYHQKMRFALKKRKHLLFNET